MYPDFPFEFLISGIPVSHQTNNKANLRRWQQIVEDTAREALPEGAWATELSLSVTVFYFPLMRLESDLDNSTKPILDALGQCVYLDDSQIERLEIQRFEPDRPMVIDNITEKLALATESDDPVIYIKIETTEEVDDI